MSEVSKRLTLDELKETQEYQCLTQKQRLFVATYCEGGLLDGNYDPVAATRTAYQCKSLEVARIMSYSILANIRIVAVLNRHFNRTPTEEFMIMLDRAVNNKKLTMAQLEALRLKCSIMGIGCRIPNKQSIGAVPADIAEASKKARKSRKDKPVETVKPTKTEYGFDK